MKQLVSKLCRAELITHLVEIERDAVSEKDAAACVLDVLDAQVFRIAPFLYGVDLSGLVEEDDVDRVSAVSEALSAQLGKNSVEITTLILDPPEPEVESHDGDPGMEEDILLLMRAVATAADKVAAENNTGSRALLSAEFAVRAAELTAKGLADLSAAPIGNTPDLAPTLQETADVLQALDGRLDAMSQSLSELAASPSDAPESGDMTSSVVAALEGPLCQIEARISERLNELNAGQIPAEWFLGQIMSRIGNLDEQLTGTEQETRAEGISWARRLDSRISEVADQLIPPEWFLGRILTRIGELDEQLSGNDQQVRSAAEDWAQRLDNRLSSIADQMVPPEWFLGKILNRVDALEDRFCGSMPADAEAYQSALAAEIADLRQSQASMAASIASIKGRLTSISKKQESFSKKQEESTELIKTSIAEILARI